MKKEIFLFPRVKGALSQEQGCRQEAFSFLLIDFQKPSHKHCRDMLVIMICLTARIWEYLLICRDREKRKEKQWMKDGREEKEWQSFSLLNHSDAGGQCLLNLFSRDSYP